MQTRKDDLDEPDEAFTVRLSDPTGATLEDDTGSGRITDDDAPVAAVPTLSIADAAAVEGETAGFVVR